MPQIPLHLFQPVLTTAAMRWADRVTIDELGVPGRLLMETAGRGAADVIERELGEAADRRILVVCGEGNNGGDGLVVARVLHARGAVVRVVVPAKADDLTRDAATNLRLLQEIAEKEDGIEILITTDPGELDRYWPEWVIDALLGIGAGEPLRPPINGLARFINRSPARIAALDIPTGLDSDTGEAAEDAVIADFTVTMAAPKAGLLYRSGPRHAGVVHTVEIGIPRHMVDDAVLQSGAGWMSTDAAVRALLPPRPHGAHKYTAGRVFVIAGSREFPGAAVMAGQAAAQAGAGAVLVATSESARDVLEQKLTEVMTIPLPETSDGTLAGGALALLAEKGNEADAVLIGPGLGRHPDTQALVHSLLERLEKPIVIDADALNALAEHDDAFDSDTGQWILTPHLGEMRRLAGNANLDETRPYDLARTWAQRLGCTLLLKGAPSVVATPRGDVFIAGATTPALATAGTGDVLAGVTAGLLAQGLEPDAAAIVALHLTGRAAERYATRHAPRTMLATDILKELPYVIPA